MPGHVALRHSFIAKSRESSRGRQLCMRSTLIGWCKAACEALRLWSSRTEIIWLDRVIMRSRRSDCRQPACRRSSPEAWRKLQSCLRSYDR